MALALMIDGVDHISELVHESLKIDQTNDGLNSTCEFDIRDAGVIEKDAWTVEVTRVEDGDVITGHTAFSEPKVEVSIVDEATVYFSGILSRITLAPGGLAQLGDYLMPTEQILHCHCHGFNMMLEESVIDTLEEYKNKTDEFVIDDLFTKYVTGIDFATHVDGGVHTFISIFFENMTIRQAMNHIVGRTGYIWYVDYSKKLHYSAAEANAPAWHLSDVPDQVNSFSYFDPVEREVDATNLVNMVYFVHSAGADWFTDEASRAKYGDHKFILRDERFSIPESIEGRANALLDKFANPIETYTIKTYKDGLRAGMHVRFVCAYLDLDDTLLINSLQVTFPVDGEPVYALTLGGLESSIGGSARRLDLDHWQDPAPVTPGQLPLASRGWGHDLVFSATDNDTVAWEAGTLTTASGQDFAIGAGNTDDPGAMTEKTIVYLDLVEDPTAPHDLQMTTVETAALGAMKIMVAVCWPSGEATVDAGFQVFGATGELATYLNATNVIANCITANEIAALTITTAEIAANTIVAGDIAANTITANEIAADTITAAEIAALTITAAEIAANTITATEIAGLTITAAELAADCITADKIDALAVDTEHLAADCITAAKIDALAVDTEHLAVGAVEAAKINVAQLDAIAANMGVLTAGEIRMYANTWDVDADGFRLLAAEIAGQLNGIDQIVLSGTDGKLRAGAGAVILDAAGITITGGKFSMVTAAAGNPRIEITNTEIAGYGGVGGNVLQFKLRAADGVAEAGAGAVWMDENGLSLEYDTALSKVAWRDGAGNALASLHSELFGPQVGLLLHCDPIANVGSFISITAKGGPIHNDSYIWVKSPGTGGAGEVQFNPRGAGAEVNILVNGVLAQVNLETCTKIYNDLRVQNGLYVGDLGVGPDTDDIWVADHVRIGQGLYVGDATLTSEADDNDIWCEGEISTDGGTTRWALGNYAAVIPTIDGYVVIVINGNTYRVAVESI